MGSLLLNTPQPDAFFPPRHEPFDLTTRSTLHAFRLSKKKARLFRATAAAKLTCEAKVSGEARSAGRASWSSGETARRVSSSTSASGSIGFT